MKKKDKVEYSVIIPAYNEEKYLPKTLDVITEAVKRLSFIAEGEIIVVNNNSADNTEKIARKYNVEVVFEKHNQISKARNRGADAASGEFFIFLDADTLISCDLLEKVIFSMKKGNVYAGGTNVVFDEKVPLWAKLLTAFWNRMAFFNKWAAGSFVFCRRDAFYESGKFNESLYASEEIWLCIRLRKWAKRKNRKYEFIFFRNDYVITSARKFRWFSSFSILAHIFLPVLVPFGLYSRNLCAFWYKRPEK